MEKIIKVLGVGLKDKNGKISRFVNSDIFDKRKTKKLLFSNPYINLYEDEKELKKIKKNIEKTPFFKEYEIVLADLEVSIDLSLIYKEGLAQIDSVSCDRVYISLVDGEKSGYQYFNNDECILAKKIVEHNPIKQAPTQKKPEKIAIKASFADSINTIIDCNNKKLPDWMETKEVILDNDNEKEEIINFLNNCESYSINDDNIYFIVKRTQQEIDNYFKDQDVLLEHEINRLKKWFSSNKEDATQIKEYLEFKKLDWILNRISTDEINVLGGLVADYDKIHTQKEEGSPNEELPKKSIVRKQR